MSERLGDAPIQQEYRAAMNTVAQAIDAMFNGGTKGADRKAGFVLLSFRLARPPPAVATSFPTVPIDAMS